MVATTVSSMKNGVMKLAKEILSVLTQKSSYSKVSSSLPYWVFSIKTVRLAETFVKQKGSSDVKGSLWSHLDKKVLLWHREAPLFKSLALTNIKSCDILPEAYIICPWHLAMNKSISSKQILKLTDGWFL